MNKWNGKVGDVVKPFGSYCIKAFDHIGYVGGGLPKNVDVIIEHDCQILLLEVGRPECIAKLSQTFLGKYDGLVFKISTKTLIGWWKKSEEDKRERAKWCKNIEQTAVDRAKWC